MRNSNNKKVAIDIGSSFIRLAYGEINDKGGLEVRGVIEKPSCGVSKGNITDFDEALKSIKSLFAELKGAYGYSPTSICLALNSGMTETVYGSGGVAKKYNESIINEKDISAAINNARINLNMDSSKIVLHSFPVEYKVNGVDKITNPMNMPATSLEISVVFLMCSNERIAAFSRLFRGIGVKVEAFYASQVVSLSSLINKEEKNDGVIVIDIGEKTSSLISYLGGNLTSITSIPFGGGTVTDDIAYILQKNTAYSKKLKEEYGCAYPPSVNKDSMITIKAENDEDVRFPQSELSSIIYPRMHEIFKLLKNDFDKVPRYGVYSSGISLIGGGSLLSGCQEVGKSVFSLPTRMGFPEALPGLSREYINPKYVNVLGALKQAYMDSPLYKGKKNINISDETEVKESFSIKGLWKKLF